MMLKPDTLQDSFFTSNLLDNNNGLNLKWNVILILMLIK